MFPWHVDSSFPQNKKVKAIYLNFVGFIINAEFLLVLIFSFFW